MASATTPDPESRARVREETAGHLRALYTVAAGLGLAFALERLFRTDVDTEDLMQEYVPLLIAFIATLIPFFHGAMRHMYSAWSDERDPSPGIMLFDFVSFFAQAAAFFAMAAFIRQPEDFAWALLTLLAIDVVWLAVRRAFTRERMTMPWLWINLGAIALLFLVILGDQVGVVSAGQVWWIMLIALLRTAADYRYTMEFYFGKRQGAQP